MLIAQSISENLTLVSYDDRLTQYDVVLLGG